MEQVCKKWHQVAVIDGEGECAEVYLGLESEDGDDWQDLPWPEDWPKWVSAGFLRERHFEVRTA